MPTREERLRLAAAAQGAVRACSLRVKGRRGPEAIVDAIECVEKAVPEAVEKARAELKA